MTRRRQGRWLLNRFGFPRPIVPADNPMSAGKVELGRYLFYDKRISANGKESCGSCLCVEMQDPPSPVLNDEEAVEQLERDRRHGEEVERGDRLAVIHEEG